MCRVPYLPQTHSVQKTNTLKILLLAKKCPPEKNQDIAAIKLSQGSYQVKGDPDVKQDYSEVKQYSRRAIALVNGNFIDCKKDERVKS